MVTFTDFNTTLVLVQQRSNMARTVKPLKFQYNTCFGSTMEDYLLEVADENFNTTLVLVHEYSS
ncbi:MAG: hypothetical protein LBP40_08590 [Campylobacteraceae bacterium]|nr:hypothetical protein [Campylobacteraceae bacterium]